MIVRVLAVGRVKGPLRDAVADYQKRASRYWRLEVEDLGPQKGARSPARAREGEGDRILSRLRAASQVVALTRNGKTMGSVELERYLGDAALNAVPDVVFVIGGAHGLAPAVLERADRTLALSKLTFPHDLARVVLLEQLYRAGTIRRGEPYHKGVEA